MGACYRLGGASSITTRELIMGWKEVWEGPYHEEIKEPVPEPEVGKFGWVVDVHGTQFLFRSKNARKEAFKFYRDQLDLFTPPPEEKPCLKTREEVAAFINDQFRDKYGCSREKGGWHYRKQDLRVLMDFLYDGEPLSDEQKITGE